MPWQRPKKWQKDKKKKIKIFFNFPAILTRRTNLIAQPKDTLLVPAAGTGVPTLP